MANENTILSLNPDGRTLVGHELALRESGFEVISVPTAVQARFEIEMGRCGVFLTSYITLPGVRRDLVHLFRRNCPHGVVIFVTSVTQDPDDLSLRADLLLSDRDQPENISERIYAMRRLKAS
jgi:hypothetical protein